VQQVTGPMMAKSLEDTTFYRYFHLLALNEVGGDPVLPALSAADFHQRMIERASVSPHGLTATATHDTKRGEDARARILALSELPDEWAEEAKAWAALNADFADASGPRRAPSHAHEYMLYQTLVGAWPLDGQDESFTERIQAYALKAAREGKLETSWTNPNESYERGLARFITSILDPKQSSQFLARVDAFAQRIALIGALNGLAQLALKATMPGVPDFYQGTEFWDLSLVDPDNRRPIDFAARADALRAVAADPDWSAFTASWQDGRVKLALTCLLLALRTELPDLFTNGAYRPLEVSGPDRDHILAFARSNERDTVFVIIGRHLARVAGGGGRWPNSLPWDATVALGGEQELRNVLEPQRRSASGPEISVSELLGPLPVALLHARKVDSRRNRTRIRSAPALAEPATA
jgi:(1->4)-alpha-D-glucan 1-alpha-D-glucosylmutase